ncbi:hypothetical protein [Halobacillus sp. B23F22_1]|uniref:hypothetical protein n=1 Tax=Halobacillus sp. B23F22_1 TaxID=3459514 RepID=UPI00373E07B4
MRKYLFMLMSITIIMFLVHSNPSQQLEKITLDDVEPVVTSKITDFDASSTSPMNPSTIPKWKHDSIFSPISIMPFYIIIPIPFDFSFKTGFISSSDGFIDAMKYQSNYLV